MSIPDVAGDLGSRWGDLDAMTIGEQWLQGMLALRDGVSPDAATGWAGGGYRHGATGASGRRPAHVVGPAGPGRHVRLGAAGLGRRPDPAPAVVHAGYEVTAVFATTAQLVSSAQQALGNAG